jgi:hypothetical protein
LNADNDENLFIKANAACKMNFNGNDDSAYIEVNLSKPKFQSLQLSDDDTTREKSMLYRVKRLDPTRQEYSEHADERVHDVDEQYLQGELAKIFAFFKGKPCRVRIACLKAGRKINPHVDYDPSYIFRYHVPLITHENAKLGAVTSDGEVSTHFAADGRVYWINTGIKHWAFNDSPIDRYHLLIDVTGDKEVENLDHLEQFN